MDHPHQSPQLPHRLIQAKWLRFLSEVCKSDTALEIELQQDPDIAHALKLVEVGGYSEMELETYHIHMDKSRIESTVIADAKAAGLQQGQAQVLSASWPQIEL